MSPALLGHGTTMEVAQAVATALLGVWLLASSTEGWMLRGPLSLPMRLAAAATAIALMVPEGATDLIGVAAAVLIVAWQARAYPRPARA
jgi:TRAP-type uncharacterized transport system fused permease subunit